MAAGTMSEKASRFLAAIPLFMATLSGFYISLYPYPPCPAHSSRVLGGVEGHINCLL